ncbi:hypothetical protein [Janibacter sp. GXQ6167]|uniref:hypothetical protein n=1 Tax=Janibacter sp. GXQ6167 TaxID=3240791 RepID=UPI003524F1CB
MTDGPNHEPAPDGPPLTSLAGPLLAGAAIGIMPTGLAYLAGVGAEIATAIYVVTTIPASAAIALARFGAGRSRSAQETLREGESS